MVFPLGSVALVAISLIFLAEATAAFSTSLSRLHRGKSRTAFVPATSYHDKFAPRSSVLSTDLSMGKVEEFLTGRDDKARKTENEGYLANLQKRVDKINELEANVEELGDDELMAKTEEFKERLKNGENINGPILEEAYTVVREAAWYADWCSFVCFLVAFDIL